MRVRKANNKSLKTMRGIPNRLILFVLLPAMVIFIAYLGIRFKIYNLSFSFFPVKEVVFIGNRHLANKELLAIMGENTGDLLFLSCRDLSARLRKSPWIKNVSILKKFPDRLVLKIEEAAPFAFLEMKDRTFLIDGTGNLLEEVKGDTVFFLPVIAGDPFGNQYSFSESLRLVNVLKEKGLSVEKGRIEVISAGDKAKEGLLAKIDDVVVKIGYGEYEEKVDRFIEIQDEVSRKGLNVDYIDLRFANKVVVKPVNEVVR